MDVVHDPYAPAPPPGQDELPCEDGEPMETPRHRKQMNLLIETLEHAWSERRDFYVGGNMFVYYSELQARSREFRGPDVFVVLDTDRDKVRKSWVAWQEGGQLPDVVIELLSETTREIDRGVKKQVYERIWRTGRYVLYDFELQTLEGFELVGGKYVPMVADARGHLWIASLELAVGVVAGEQGPWLRWIDAQGQPLPTAAEAEAARADAERVRADAAQKRVAELEAMLRART